MGTYIEKVYRAVQEIVIMIEVYNGSTVIVLKDTSKVTFLQQSK